MKTLLARSPTLPARQKGAQEEKWGIICHSGSAGRVQGTLVIRFVEIGGIGNICGFSDFAGRRFTQNVLINCLYDSDRREKLMSGDICSVAPKTSTLKSNCTTTDGPNSFVSVFTIMCPSNQLSASSASRLLRRARPRLSLRNRSDLLTTSTATTTITKMTLARSLAPRSKSHATFKEARSVSRRPSVRWSNWHVSGTNQRDKHGLRRRRRPRKLKVAPAGIPSSGLVIDAGNGKSNPRMS